MIRRVKMLKDELKHIFLVWLIMKQFWLFCHLVKHVLSKFDLVLVLIPGDLPSRKSLAMILVLEVLLT